MPPAAAPVTPAVAPPPDFAWAVAEADAFLTALVDGLPVPEAMRFTDWLVRRARELAGYGDDTAAG